MESSSRRCPHLQLDLKLSVEEEEDFTLKTLSHYSVRKTISSLTNNCFTPENIDYSMKSMCEEAAHYLNQKADPNING